jgi:mycofactocin precursor
LRPTVVLSGIRCHYPTDLAATLEKNGEQMNPEIESQTEQVELVAEDLIEEVSIDGMCGVY